MTVPVAGERIPLRSGRIVVTVLAAFLLLKVFFLAFFAINATYVMDEFAQGGYSRHLEDGFYRSLDPVKTVLWVYFFHPARILAGDSNELMMIARLEGLAMSIAVLLLSAACARRLGRDAVDVLLTLAVLLSFSNYVERSFRVRADTVAAVFAMAGLCVLLWRGRNRYGAFAAGLLAGGAFLCTQKAAYAVVALGLAVLAINGTVRERARRALLYGAAFAMALVAYGVFFGGAGFARVIEMVFTSPLLVALDADDFYADLTVYVWQTLRRNWFVYALTAAGLLAAAARFRRSEDSVRAAVVYTIVITTFVFLHNQPWPYVFVIALPPLALWAPEIPALAARWRGWDRPVLVLVILIILVFGFGRNIAYLDRVNTAQRFVVAQAEAMLGPEESYQDGVGMITKRREAVESWWDAMNATLFLQAMSAGDLREISRIFENHPKLWIVNYRILNVMPVLAPHLRNSYVRVSSNILLTGVAVSEGEEVLFVNRWPGEYRLYGPDGAPRAIPFELDGRVVSGPVTIGAGPHRVRVNARGTYGLFPSGVRLPPSSEREPPLDLFPLVYE